jgi:hypothetical protein
MRQIANALIAMLFGTTPAVADMPEHALNITRHVLAHEIGHALIREFDIPVLANEEDMADTFATLFVLEVFGPDQGGRIILDRAKAIPTEPTADTAKSSFDLQRRLRLLCLLAGAEPERWAEGAVAAGLPGATLEPCQEGTPERIRAWRRVLAPLRMPEGTLSNEVRALYGEGPMKDAMLTSGVVEEIAQAARRFDWHSQITLHADHCDEGAKWERNGRRVLLCDGYVQDFIDNAQR